MREIRAALDTNILAYAEGLNGDVRQIQTRRLIDSLDQSTLYLPAQVLGELFGLLIRKGRRSAAASRESVLVWYGIYPVMDTDARTILDAMDLVAAHRLSFWDAVIVAVSAQADCCLLVSEDMQDGFVWRGLTIANPFKPDPHPILRDLLQTPR